MPRMRPPPGAHTPCPHQACPYAPRSKCPNVRVRIRLTVSRMPPQTLPSSSSSSFLQVLLLLLLLLLLPQCCRGAEQRGLLPIYLSIYLCIYLSVYLSIYRSMYTYIHAYTYIQTYIHIHTYIHTNIHTYIHTYISIPCTGVARSRSVSALFTVFSLAAFLLLLHNPPLSASFPSLSYQLPPCLQPSSSTSPYVCM